MNEQEKQAMLDEMRKDKEGASGERKFWAPPSKEEGIYSLRFLPPLKKLNEVKFYFTHKVHWIDGVPYECLDQSLEDKNGNFHDAETCPVCKFCKKLYKTASRGDEDWKLAGELNQKTRRVAKIVVRGKEDETKPEFYEFGPTIFNILFHIMTETKFGNIVDPKKGRDFNLTKVGTGRRSKYETSTPDLDQTPIFDDVEKLKIVFENANKMDYNSLISFPTSNEITEALNEYLGIDNSKDESEVITTVSKPRPVIEKDEPAVNSSENDDEIDNILSEFTNA